MAASIIKISRHFSLDARYRFVTIRNLENFYDNRNMIYTDITYTKGISRFSIMARGRLQRQFYGSMNNENLISYRDYSRTKLQIKYKINYYLSPYISAEMHFPINNPLRKTFDQWRQTAGIVYTLNNKLKFEIFLQSQELTARKNKKNNYITAFNVYYKL
nr:DUF2490 domain-containing protein [Bacteroidota bacterium]